MVFSIENVLILQKLPIQLFHIFLLGMMNNAFLLYRIILLLLFQD